MAQYQIELEREIFAEVGKKSGLGHIKMHTQQTQIIALY
jgi:hypothetical protein